MDTEVLEIRDFLARYRPFNRLPHKTLATLAAHVAVTYVRADTPVLAHAAQIDHLYVIRSGAVEVRRSNGDLYNRMGAGHCFGQFALLRGRGVRYPVKAIEDTLLYLIPQRQFHQLCQAHDDFADYMEEDHAGRLHSAVTRPETERFAPLLASTVRSLLRRELVTAAPRITIEEAARIMTAEGVSSLVLLADGRGGSGRIAGLVTDRDLRKRAIARGLSLTTPVKEIMSTDIITCREEAHLFEAMLIMMRHNLHHLPVLRQTRPVGMITVADIVRYAAHGSVYLIGDIFRQSDVAGLATIGDQRRQLFVQMVNEDASSHMIGSTLAFIGTSLSQRLLQLGEAHLGPPPVPYCYLSLGSMARREQMVVSDQDNAIVLDDGFDPATHDAYFERLAAFVSDGLAACGYPYCSGGIMGTTARWRQPLAVWRRAFQDWMAAPEPEALLHCSIFFDLEGIHGALALGENLQDLIRREAPRNRSFLAHMARNALLRNPPLSFFRQFVLERDGQQVDTFDLKERGTAPISDLVRVHALACGSPALNTRERLDEIQATDLLPDGVAPNLLDALEFIAMVRIRHQAHQLEAGHPADNQVPPKRLSAFERRHLRNAFQIVEEAQSFLRYRYTASNGFAPIQKG
ncbi:MAG: putative nucleotidyltransferase substrate binding domain-containing protein [Desulfosarcinaceae bacterium]|nr:putative nucleotidyltransferase substrate binding domain-containing protein [Desulfosarcinaceae bacterium]